MRSFIAAILAVVILLSAVSINNISVFAEGEEASYAQPSSENGEKRQIKVLLIGNSLTEDAVDWNGTGNISHTHEIFASLCEDDVEIQLGIIVGGGKTLAWHATQAAHDNAAYALRVTDREGKWQIVSSVKTAKDALLYTDWDVVSLQPYDRETGYGYATYYGPGYEYDEDYDTLEKSIPFFLDYCAEYAPQAKVYYYVHHSFVWGAGAPSMTSLNAAKELYLKHAETAGNALEYVGKNSGRKLEGIVEVATAIQNARTTYLAMLSNEFGNASAGNGAFANDYVLGLQRDAVHLSFNVGRHIAGLTFARTLIPESLLKEGATDPGVRTSPDPKVGELPDEYSALSRIAVEYALKNPLTVTEIDGYTVDPATDAKGKVEDVSLSIPVDGDADRLIAKIKKAVGRNDIDISVTELAIEGDAFTANINLRFGYTAYDLPVSGGVTSKQLKVLLIGNSFSYDAADASRNFYGQTYKLFRSVLDDDVELQLGLIYSGGKTLAWHATRAHNGELGYPLMITDKTGKWIFEESVSNYAEAFEYTDWDCIALQTSGNEAGEGMADREADVDEYFRPVEVSVPYFLDLCAAHAPQAKVYYHMHHARYGDTDPMGERMFLRLATTAERIMTFEGKESGNKLYGIVPVGTTVQNVRTTYLSGVTNNTTNDRIFGTDIVKNLQRDTAHLSFYLGRYITGLTFVKAVTPQELLKPGAVDCGIRPISDPEIGNLPEEYANIVRLSAEAAVASPYVTTPITGFDTDPATDAKEALENAEFVLRGKDNAEEEIISAARNIIGRDDVRITVTDLEISGNSFTANIGIRFGYTAYTLPVSGNVKRQIKILLIGNSYTEDASDWTSSGNVSHTYEIFRSLCDDDVEIKLGIMVYGGRTLAWHATKAASDASVYYLRVTDENGRWIMLNNVRTMKQALQYTDWDVVSLQPYGNEASNGYATCSGEGYEYDEAYDTLAKSIPFFLDFCAEYAPQAKVYSYMHWAGSMARQIDIARGTYPKYVSVARDELTYVGTESGRKLAGIIEVGTAIQNARTTYLALQYNEFGNYSAGNSAFSNDWVYGLQRDSEHLSFNVGRYIAGLTFARTLIPDSLLKDGATDPGVRMSPDPKVGELPEEYSLLSRLAVEYALQYPFTVTDIEGYTVDPATDAKEALENAEFVLRGKDNAEEEIISAARNIIGRDDVRITVSDIEISGSSFNANINLRFGYTAYTLPIGGVVLPEYDLAFARYSLTLQSDLQINFKVKKNVLDAFDNVKAVFTMDGESVEVSNYTESDDYYVFVCSNIAPHKIGDDVTAVLYGDYNGVSYESEPITVGVQTYCYALLNNETYSQNVKLRTLLVDLLNYCTEVQKYIGRTENFANAALTETQRGWASADRTLVSVANSAYATVENPEASWTGVGLYLRDRIAVRVKLHAEDITGVSVRFSTDDGRYVNIREFVPAGDNEWYVYMSDLDASEMSEVLYITAYRGDEAISNTMRYSIESYAYAAQNSSSETLANLVKAMMRYGNSAKNYIS